METQPKTPESESIAGRLARAAELNSRNQELRRQREELRRQANEHKVRLTAFQKWRFEDGRRFQLAALNLLEDAEEARRRVTLVAAEKAQFEERLRLIVENARDYAIFSTDLERRITSWNSGAQQILGYSEAEILGVSADVIFTEEDRATGACAHEAETALQEGRASDERWHVRKDGSRFWGSGVMTAMRSQSGEMIGFVKIFRDQTEQKRVEEALIRSRAELEKAFLETDQARKEAEAANKTKDHFLATLSHELRTPLTPVVMSVESLLRRKSLPPDVIAALELIHRNVLIESEFIDDLLDVMRFTHGKVEFESELLDIHHAIHCGIEVSQPDFTAKEQTLTVELTAQNSRVRGDFARLQQLIWNLLKNASKFTPDHGTIRLSTRNETPNWITIKVADNGRGIEAGSLEKIFEPFSQESTSITRKFGGLGLGLAIAKAVVIAHNGMIVAKSEGPGKGATFTVDLPLAPP